MAWCRSEFCDCGIRLRESSPSVGGQVLRDITVVNDEGGSNGVESLEGRVCRPEFMDESYLGCFW